MPDDIIYDNRLTRRDFLKRTGTAGMGAVTYPTLNTLLKTGLAIGTGIEAVMNASCAHIGFESPEDIANIKWDANPAIPVPTNGCYVGWHYDLAPIFLGMGGERYVKLVGKEEVDKNIGRFKEYCGKKPAAMSFFDRHVKDEWFPEKVCNALSSHGVIPIIRYYFSSRFDKIAKGEFDNELIRFAKNAKEFGKPFFFIPYPEVNISHHAKNVHPWAGGGGKGFKEAWARMHNIFDSQGANEYAVWGLHLIGPRGMQPFSRFAVDKKLVDWIGFTIYNLKSESYWSGSLHSLITDGYSWAQRKYPNKPIALWEFAKSNTRNQGRWIKKAYETIKNLPRIKMVVYAEYSIFGGGVDSCIISDKAKPSYRGALSDTYFIGSKKL